MNAHIRQYEQADLERRAEIRNLIYPDHPTTVDELRYRENAWPKEGYDRLRLVTEDATGRVVGCGIISHMIHQYHPRKYWLEVEIDPARQCQGYGSALYDRLIDELRNRNAIAANSEARESLPRSVSFLRNRGFVDVEREWESSLPVASFPFERFDGAEERVKAQGIEITTLEQERAKNPDVLPAVYDTHMTCLRDVPSHDPITSAPYEQWLAREIDAPMVLPEAYFLAKDGDRIIGESVLERSDARPDMLYQQLTGVLPEYRGRGIAMALKLRTVRYAQERGVSEIRTWNSTLNRAMLRINEAMGFEKKPAWIGFQKNLS